MRKRIIGIAVLTTVFSLLVGGMALAAEIATKDAAKYVGQKVTVKGTIASALCTTEKGKSSYLNLDAPFPQDPFVVRIAGEDCQKLNLDLYKKGTPIAVTGTVEMTPSKKPYIQVTDQAQIVVKRPEKK
jgi:hypothetical protein